MASKQATDAGNGARADQARTPLVVVGLLALLYLSGLGVRFLGVDFCLPHMREMDSEIVTQLSHLRGKPLRSKTNRTYYATYPMIPAVVAWAATSPPPEEFPEGLSDEQALDEHLARAADDYGDMRKAIAFLSALLIPVTWLLARRFVGPWWALYAAALMWGSLLHQFFSQEARPHGPAAVAFALTMLAILRMRRRPTTGAYVLVGLALVYMLGTLQSGIAMGVPLVVAHLLREEPRGHRLLDPRILLPGLILLVSIPATYWPLFDPALKDVESVVSEDTVAMPGHVVEWSRFNGGGLETTIDTLRSYEPMLSALSILALLVFLVTRLRPRVDYGEHAAASTGKDVLVMLAFVLPYGFMISLWEENYERFLIPLLPFLACLTAWSGRELATRSRGALRGAVTAAFLVCLALPVYATGRLAWLRHTPDTVERAATWIAEHADPVNDRIFVTPWWDLPLPRTTETLHEKIGGRAFHVISPWKGYQAGLEDDAIPGTRWRVTTMVVVNKYDGSSVEGLREYLDDFGPGYYVIDAKKRGHPWMKWMADELAARGERVARMSPDKDAEAWNYPLFDQDGVAEDWPDLTPRVLNARSVGPVVEIYRVD